MLMVVNDCLPYPSSFSFTMAFHTHGFFPFPTSSPTILQSSTSSGFNGRYQRSTRLLQNTKLYATSKKGRSKKKSVTKSKSSKILTSKKEIMGSKLINSNIDESNIEKDNLQNLSEEEQEAKVQALLDRRFKGMGNENSIDPSRRKKMKNSDNSNKNDRRLDEKMNVFASSPLSGQPASNNEPVPAGKKKVLVKNIDIFTMIPASIQNGFETLLIALLSVNLLVLLTIGISFSVGAYAVSTNTEIPSYIATTIKPWEDYFNPLTGSFFAISVLLGSFKVAQLSSGDNEYVEYIEDE